MSDFRRHPVSLSHFCPQYTEGMKKNKFKSSVSALGPKEMSSHQDMTSGYRQLGGFFSLLLKIDRRINPERYEGKSQAITSKAVKLFDK